jgi:serine/threonine protein kinase
MISIPKFLIDKYETVEFVDEGAFGSVYRCTRSSATSAVKILTVSDSVARIRFEREAEILQNIDHKHIVKVLDVGEDDGLLWYESEYATGGHFGKIHAYFYSDLERVKYFIQICLGVQALHELQPPLIHRDLKPSNILVFGDLHPERETVLKIADFGIAAIAGDDLKLTSSGSALGTASYVAPELLKNSRIKHPRVDVYSLGITFLEACTGYTQPGQENIDLVPQLLRPIVAKMVRQRANERYQSVTEVLQELKSFSVHRLLFGRDFDENDRNSEVWHVNISGELDRAFSVLMEATPDNVLDRLAAFERKLDRLGDAHDHEADAIMRIMGSILSVIDAADRDALLNLVQRFLDAADKTKGQDFFSPVPDMWANFLADGFKFSSYRATKNLCLEGLARFLVQFKTSWTKNYLYLTIQSIEDPSYLQHLATCLREIGYENLAKLLDGALEDRPIDLNAIGIALHEI